MAIQVNGTQVIGNSRELTNITSIDATSAAAIEAAGIGGGAGFPIWDPTTTPDVTLTSSGTWTKPSLADGTWILVYMVGGGGAGTVEGNNWANGGAGGGAHIFSGQATEFPSSVAFTVGAGGVPNGGDGGDTSCTIQGKVYSAGGGDGGDNGTNIPSYGGSGKSAVVYSGIAPFETLPSSEGPSTDNILAGANNQVFGDGKPSIYGGASGGTARNGGLAGGTSTYAGSGGSGIGSQEKNGGFPGGAGGGRTSGAAGSGGAGVVKIWYIGD